MGEILSNGNTEFIDTIDDFHQSTSQNSSNDSTSPSHQGRKFFGHPRSHCWLIPKHLKMRKYYCLNKIKLSLINSSMRKTTTRCPLKYSVMTVSNISVKLVTYWEIPCLLHWVLSSLDCGGTQIWLEGQIIPFSYWLVSLVKCRSESSNFQRIKGKTEKLVAKLG